ncbi:MAG TPA: hypothetical protein VF630_08290 [Hymenobacter sp.]
MTLRAAYFPLPAGSPIGFVHRPVVAGHGLAPVKGPFGSGRRCGMNLGAGKPQQANEKQSNTQHKNEFGDTCNQPMRRVVATRYLIINLNQGIIIINSEPLFNNHRSDPQF